MNDSKVNIYSISIIGHKIPEIGQSRNVHQALSKYIGRQIKLNIADRSTDIEDLTLLPGGE